MSLNELCNHVRTKNPSGRGRHYSIPRIIQACEGGALPKRITVDRRLRAYCALEERGIEAEGLLNEKARSTRLRVRA